ncbi:MAG: C4-type zinc ribbon domain-containing protein [Acidobacteria bacterium]|nr:C4-type zinc ribbon domain-containing protein [Acidobacteriota bacterium]
MLPELERLIRLQRLETATAEAQQAIEGLPAESAALDARLAALAAEVDGARSRVADHRTARQEAENALAQVQTRLARYKDQLMAVKTNKEYRAMQAEIATAEAEVARLEDQVLEQMLQADELTTAVAAAERTESDERSVVEAEREALEERQRKLLAQVERHAGERAALVDELPAHLSALFDTLTRGRKGLAVAEARDGRCMSCRVRLRPQLYNDIRLNRNLIQCESCQRILYHPSEPGATTGQPS